MTTYTVTTELKTSWWLKLLRYFRLKKKKEEFEIVLDWHHYQLNCLVFNGEELKVLSKKE